MEPLARESDRLSSQACGEREKTASQTTCPAFVAFAGPYHTPGDRSSLVHILEHSNIT